ncbi:MAG TPA: NAC family transcription factor [Methanoregula sp.]|nr:NAC family transcription factor [Methanoregula sp.]
MGGDDKDGYYCSICGGIPPDKITTKRVLIDGKETGIDHLDWIFEEVTKLKPPDDAALAEELMKRVREFNYVPTKKSDVYAAALLAEYKKPRI